MSINDTVTAELRNRGLNAYATQAEPVVTALVQREEGIADEIIEAARSEGINPDQVRTVLTNAGMHVATPTTAAAGTADDDLERRVAQLEQELSAAKNRFGF